MSAHRILADLLIADFAVEDPGAGGTIDMEQAFQVVPVETSAAEARTLAQPLKDGLFCGVVLASDGGDLTLTVTGGWNATGDTTMTFDDASDWVLLYSIEVGGSYYWKVAASEGIDEVLTIEIDVHALTALGAAPAVADLVAVSDESATGDPTRSVTVQQLMNAVNALTALGAAPAVSDSVLLDDAGTAKKCTVANLFQSYFEDMTPAAGISGGTGTICEHRVSRVGGLYKTEILIDLTDLHSTGADDVIGLDGTAEDCNLGQITAAKNGTIIAGRVTCFETPGGGDPDVDLYASTASDASESDDVTALAGTGKLIDHGDWTAEEVDHLSALPAADEYLYLAAGAATDADYTGGILLVELWGK